MLRIVRLATVALLTTFTMVVGSLLTTTAASASVDYWCDEALKCYIVLSSPPTDPAPAPDENGWTAGAAKCYVDTGAFIPDTMLLPENKLYEEVPCGDGSAYWSNERQCYVSMKSGSWPERPSNFSQDAGYYVCLNNPVEPVWASYFWSETVPPGLKVLPPGKAAEQLISTFQLRGIDIGMAPEVNPEWGHRRSYVGVPVWFWVDNPQPLTWGPYEETATLGGQTITATAQVTSVRWVTGDGMAEVCGNTGTIYSTGYGVSDSPTCGHRYLSTSESQPGDRYTVTAESQWTVTWTSLGGASGTVNLTATNSADLEVNEMQTVNTGGSNPNG